MRLGDERPKPAAFARPVPDQYDDLFIRRAEFDEKYRGRPHVPRSQPSLSWWLKGGLIADIDGPGLIDADGLRHQFPFPAAGCALVRASSFEMTIGTGRHDRIRLDTALFVAAPDSYGRQALLRLPAAGFYAHVGGPTHSDELKHFADRAGMRFDDRIYPSALSAEGRNSVSADFPGYLSVMSWEGAIHDQAWHTRRLRGPGHLLRSVLRRGEPEWQKIMGIQ